MDSNTIYQNDNYSVFLARNKKITIEGVEFPGAYTVKNNHTGIEEFYTPCLPEALRIAVHWDIAVSRENHLWPYKHFEDGNDEEIIPSGELLQ